MTIAEIIALAEDYAARRRVYLTEHARDIYSPACITAFEEMQNVQLDLVDALADFACDQPDELLRLFRERVA